MPSIKFILFFLVFSLFSSFTEADGKDILRGTCYFGNAWPINFWNSDISNADKDFEILKDEGFNTIIFVVPWGEFQPGMNPVYFNENAYTRLSKICDIAKKYDLKVFLRVSYLWDIYPGVEQKNKIRLHDLFISNNMVEKWLLYLKKIAYATNGKIDGAFISWEEFWGIIETMSVKRQVNESVLLSKNLGFDEWIRNKDTEYKDVCSDINNKYGGYPIPDRHSKYFALVFQWFDERLSKYLLPVLSQAFPKIASIEARVDLDPIYDGKKVIEWYSHDSTYNGMESPYLFTYWAPAIGAQNNGETRKAVEAIHTFDYTQKVIASHTDKKIFINQFLFEDNTPSAVNNAKIASEDMDFFFEKIGEKIIDLTSGYATWGARDYRACLLFNGAFALGQLGWNLQGDARLVSSGKDTKILLGEGGILSQDIPKERDHYTHYAKENTLEMRVSGHGILEISFADKKYKVSSNDNTESIKVILPVFSCDTTLSIKNISGTMSVHNLYLYNFIWKSNIRDIYGNKEHNMSRISMLNKYIKEKQKAPSSISVEDKTIKKFTKGTFDLEKDGNGKYFVWAEPDIEANLFASGQLLHINGYIKPSLFIETECSIDVSIDDNILYSQKFIEDNPMKLDISIPEKYIHTNIDVKITSSCKELNHAVVPQEQRNLGFILTEIKTNDVVSTQ